MMTQFAETDHPEINGHTINSHYDDTQYLLEEEYQLSSTFQDVLITDIVYNSDLESPDVISVIPHTGTANQESHSLEHRELQRRNTSQQIHFDLIIHQLLFKYDFHSTSHLISLPKSPTAITIDHTHPFCAISNIKPIPRSENDIPPLKFQIHQNNLTLSKYIAAKSHSFIIFVAIETIAFYEQGIAFKFNTKYVFTPQHLNDRNFLLTVRRHEANKAYQILSLHDCNVMRIKTEQEAFFLADDYDHKQTQLFIGDKEISELKPTVYFKDSNDLPSDLQYCLPIRNRIVHILHLNVFDFNEEQHCHLFLQANCFKLNSCPETHPLTYFGKQDTFLIDTEIYCASRCTDYIEDSPPHQSQKDIKITSQEE